MANLVITIGRENGSGGRQLGSELAEALGVKCYDSELINETAKASGFAESLSSRMRSSVRAAFCIRS